MKKYFIAFVAALALVACKNPNVLPDPDPVDPGEANYMSKSAKRGICYNGFSESDLELMCPHISWAYNWGSSTGTTQAAAFDANGIDYCPMVWSGTPKADIIREYVQAHPSTKYLLAFNEPNLTDQANMVPSAAAELWPDLIALAKELNLKVVSPAMNYGTLSGYSEPTKWLDEFFAQPGVSIDDIDAISVHCYMASMSGLQGFIEKFRKYNKPIWLTEFCAWDPAPSNAEKQKDYMCHCLNYLEQEPLVQRYSWFMLKTNNSLDKVPFNQLVDHKVQSQLTEQGEIYTMMSTFDTNTWLNTCRAIHAGEYVSTSNNAILLRPTDDYKIFGSAGANGLKITSFGPGTELTYQIYNANKTTMLAVHHCGYANATVQVKVDGTSMGEFDLPRNGSLTEWAETNLIVAIPAGKHTLSIEPVSGSCAYSGFIVK